MDGCRKCPGQNSFKSRTTKVRGRKGFLHSRTGIYEKPTVQSILHRERLEAKNSTLNTSVQCHTEILHRATRKEKGKTTSLCQQHRLTCKQPCKGRKSLSLARKYIQPVSESKIKTSLTTAMQTEDTYKFNQSSVALSVETTHTVYRNEEQKARMAASDIHLCMHGRF